MENKPARTTEQIQVEYQQLCTKAGDLQYKIRCYEKDLELVNASMQNLNTEYIQVSQVEAQVKAQLEAEKAAKESEQPKLAVIEGGESK